MPNFLYSELLLGIEATVNCIKLVSTRRQSSSSIALERCLEYYISMIQQLLETKLPKAIELKLNSCFSSHSMRA